MEARYLEQDTVVSEDFGFLIGYGIVIKEYHSAHLLVLGVGIKKDLEDCRPQGL